MATPFTPRFDPARVQLMQSLLQQSTLPENSVASPEHVPQELGVDLDWLRVAKQKLESFNVNDLEDRIKQFQHFTAEVEHSSVHFIHEKSSDPHAIPLIILHGWPGTFFDFHKIIKRLAHPEDVSHPSFHVVVPSLPGYGWSSLPRQKSFNAEDIARIFDKLMTETLGYKHYVGQGGDWGSLILRFTAKNHFKNAPLLHFNMFTAPPSGPASYIPLLAYFPVPAVLLSSLAQKAKFWGLTTEEVKLVQRQADFAATGRGYSALHSTKPATAGYALGASPLSLLAYIGEKVLAWSDPALLDIDDLLATVAIYYLTDSFSTSVMMYNQNQEKVKALSTYKEAWGNMKSTIGCSHFPYEIGMAPQPWVARCANLVQYNSHSKGGHFPALDNPNGLVEDIRNLVAHHWLEQKIDKKSG